MTHADGLTSSATTLTIIDQAARGAGLGNVHQHLSRWPGLPYRSRLSHDTFTRLFMSLAVTSRDDAIGLKLAMQAPLRAFNVAVYTFLSGPTLGVGLEQWERYQAIHTLASRIRIVHEGNLSTIKIDLADGALPTTRSQREYYLVLLWRYMLWQTGEAVCPVEIRLRRPDRRGSPHEQLLGCQVSFDQPDDAIVIPREAWAAASIHACPEVFQATTRMADMQLMALNTNRVELRIQLALRDLAEDARPPDLAAVASKLNMSVRTVQRRLADEETSFKQVLDKFYAEHARRMLTETNVSIAEIADSCGFVDRRSFYRAFQRWTAQTPALYRRNAAKPSMPPGPPH
ncbi:AraC family transcriptional regulator [Sphingomonas oligophenolica]|uniref:AraC family transcriptional regulator ligand-binding domain-containing protein n=1 Tax=Sphingomonas oligophenolica TaxID=301154 RepID=A0ABU9Y965_9SPHN